MPATVFVFGMMFIGVMSLWWPWERTDHLGVMWHARPGSLCHQQLVSPAPIHFINSFMFAFPPLLNIVEHQWDTAEAAIIISNGDYFTIRFVVSFAEDVKRPWEWCASSCCSFFLLLWPLFLLLIYMFLYSFCVFKHTLTLRSKAATLSNVCLPLLLEQTGYYDFPKSGSILTQATLIILTVICLDLHHIPHKQYCMQIYNLFLYSCFLAGVMKHRHWSHSLWWKHFPTRLFHSQMLAFHFLLFCCVGQVWKMHFCSVFILVYTKKNSSYLPQAVK